MTDSATLREVAEKIGARWIDETYCNIIVAEIEQALLALATEKAELARQLKEAREAAFQEFEDYHEYNAAMADGMDMAEQANFHEKIAKAIRNYPDRHASRAQPTEQKVD